MKDVGLQGMHVPAYVTLRKVLMKDVGLQGMHVPALLHSEYMSEALSSCSC